MNKFLPKSIKSRLFLLYTVSQAGLIIYFLLFIHYYTIAYGIQILIFLFLLLGTIQFFIIYRFTNSISRFSSKIKKISSRNLEEKVEGFQEDEIGDLAKSFNNLLERLNEAFRREQQFIGDVAHELKTPLSTLRSSLEVALSKNRTKGEYQKVIETAIVEADLLSSTLNNVLDLAWSETPEAQKIITKFNLSDLMEDLFEITQKIAKPKNVQVKLSNTKGVLIAGYKDKLARAILNIIENAFKYTQREGLIELILEKTPTKVLISVIDNGKGIPEAEIPHIFDRFYRGSETTNVGGSGLGLAITKSIIKLHLGEIVVKSKPGQGTTMVIVLPRSS